MLSERIKELRTAKGMNQVALADKLSVTKQSVSNWENGYIQPSVDMLIKLSELFSVTTDYILGRTEKRLLDVTGLSDTQVAHIQFIIDEIKNNKL